MGRASGRPQRSGASVHAARARRPALGPQGALRRGALLGGLALALALADDRAQAFPEESEAPPLVYALCRSNLASLQILPPRDGDGPFAIAAQLGPQGREELAQLTAQHVGRPLEIVIGDWLFLRAPIRGPVHSGSLVNTVFPSRERAEAALRHFRGELRETPCGLQAG